MKVLHIVTSMDPQKGGVCQAVRNYIYENKFCENEVVSLDDQMTDFGMFDQFVIHKLGIGFSSFQYNASLLNWLKKNLPNYSHAIVHGMWQYHNFATFLALKAIKKESRPKLAIMPHGMLDPYFQKEPTRKLKALRNEIIWRLTECRSINSADFLLFTCQVEMELARTTFRGYKPQKEFTVGLGVFEPPIYLESFSKAFENLCPGVKGSQFLLFLSRIDFKKGIDLLINSYNLLSQENPHLPHLVIAGPIESNHAKEMILLATGNPNIHFTGMLRGSEKWGALYGCEAFILPSHQENFGIAVAEALACSKPVLISNKVNIYKEIEVGGAGIVNEDDFEGTLTNLKCWIDLSLIEKQKMCDAAHRVYLEHFNVENAVKKLVQELNSNLSN